MIALVVIGLRIALPDGWMILDLVPALPIRGPLPLVKAIADDGIARRGRGLDLPNLLGRSIRGVRHRRLRAGRNARTVRGAGAGVQLRGDEVIPHPLLLKVVETSLLLEVRCRCRAIDGLGVSEPQKSAGFDPHRKLVSHFFTRLL